MFDHNVFAEKIANKPRSAAHNHSFMLTTLIFCAVTLSMASTILWFILVIAGIALLMRILLYMGKHQHVPNARLINLLAILSGACLVYLSREMTLLPTMINLLVLASSLKIMVLSNQKDLMAIILSLLFLTTLGFVYHPTIGFTLFYAVIIFSLILALAIHFAPRQQASKLFKKTGILVIQTLPLVAILFILTPNFSPFWHMPQPKQHNTGLTDVVKPGSIADLAKSTELAFSARFANDASIPKFHERYWRAVVLDQFDGQQWHMSAQQKAQLMIDYTPLFSSTPHDMPNNTSDARTLQYQITLQPNSTHYAPSLRFPSAVIDSDSPIALTSLRTLNSDTIVDSPMQYEVRSSASSTMKDALIDTLAFRQLPTQGNPRTQAWVQQLSQSNANLQQWIETFNRHLLDNNFSYTLQPPLMMDNTVDQFLFDNRTGFCSHYATAMGYVLRLAGFQTRLVAGYQGGTLIKNNTMLVHQYDAHAWLEVYSAEQGWQLLDPTAVIANTRVRQSLLEQLQQQDEDIAWAGWHRFKNDSLIGQLRENTQWFQLQFQSVLLQFNQADHQALIQRLMSQFNIAHPVMIGVLGLIAMASVIALYFVWSARPKPIQDKPSRYYYTARQHCILLLRATHNQTVANMPPQAFQEWVMHHHALLGAAMLPLSNGIQTYLYSPASINAADIHALKQAMHNVRNIQHL